MLGVDATCSAALLVTRLLRFPGVQGPEVEGCGCIHISDRVTLKTRHGVRVPVWIVHFGQLHCIR